MSYGDGEFDGIEMRKWICWRRKFAWTQRRRCEPTNNAGIDQHADVDRPPSQNCAACEGIRGGDKNSVQFITHFAEIPSQPTPPPPPAARIAAKVTGRFHEDNDPPFRIYGHPCRNLPQMSSIHLNLYVYFKIHRFVHSGIYIGLSALSFLRHKTLLNGLLSSGKW